MKLWLRLCFGNIRKDVFGFLRVLSVIAGGLRDIVGKPPNNCVSGKLKLCKISIWCQLGFDLLEKKDVEIIAFSCLFWDSFKSPMQIKRKQLNK